MPATETPHPLSLLYEVSRSFSERIDLGELIPFVIDKTRELLCAESSAVLLLDEERQELYFPFAADVAPDVAQRLNQVRFPADQGIAGWVVRHGIPQLVPDVTKDARWYPGVDRETGAHTRSMLCVPLRARHGVMGVLSLRNRVDGGFTTADLETLTALSGSIAVAIENAQLYGKLKRSEALLREEVMLLNREMAERQRAEEAVREEGAISAALASVGRELISSLDEPVLLERLCQVTAQVLACDQSYTFMRVPQQQVFVPVASAGTSPEDRETLQVLRVPHEALAGLLAQLERAAICTVTTLPTGFLPSARRQPFGDGAKLCMALRRGTEIIGIHVAGFRRGGSFHDAQFRIARGIAQLASMALENSRLVGELERANRLKSDFVAAMSHELRTPLHIIMGYNELLLDRQFGPLTPEQLDSARRIQKNAKDLLALINATLDLSRLESGRGRVETRSVSVPLLIGELETETRELQDKPGLRVTWQVPADLPMVYTDPVKLKVVLMNLIDNAAKFTPAGTVEVGARLHDGGIELSVVDTGIGIAPDVLPIIFESFRQGDPTATRRYGGVGMGLYVVRRLLDLLGGRISVDTEVGRGSAFRVWLPQRVGHEES
jgi:signal transduction histidine kinase